MNFSVGESSFSTVLGKLSVYILLFGAVLSESAPSVSFLSIN